MTNLKSFTPTIRFSLLEIQEDLSNLIKLEGHQLRDLKNKLSWDGSNPTQYHLDEVSFISDFLGADKLAIVNDFLNKITFRSDINEQFGIKWVLI